MSIFALILPLLLTEARGSAPGTARDSARTEQSLDLPKRPVLIQLRALLTSCVMFQFHLLARS